jgi:hypothetical protein
MTAQQLTAQQAARILRKDLTAQFPGTKFSVTTERGWLKVRYAGIAKFSDVETIANHYARYAEYVESYDTKRKIKRIYLTKSGVIRSGVGMACPDGGIEVDHDAYNLMIMKDGA